MTKVKQGPKMLIYPIPIVLMGANVDEKPNYNLLGNCGILSLSNPTILYVSSSKGHHTTKGAKQNKTFSVNIPSVDQVVESDYCGIVHGYDVDKSKVFDSFYGELETAPMAKECPVNMECKVINEFMAGRMGVFVGEIVETYLDKELDISPNKPTIEEINPLIYSLGGKYYQIGDFVANAYQVGKKYKEKK